MTVTSVFGEYSSRGLSILFLFSVALLYCFYDNEEVIRVGKQNQVLSTRYTESNFTFNLDKSPLERKVLSFDSILGLKLRKYDLTTTTPAPKSLDEPLDCNILKDRYHSENELKRAELMNKLNKYQPRTEEDYINMTKNCSEFVLNRGYVTNDWITGEERDFPLAFSIRIHKSIEQAERLLRAIYRPHNVHCIHVDHKSPNVLHQAIGEIAKCLPNVYISSRNVDVVYGGFGQTEADLICMRDLLESHVQWRYYLNLAGTEFPLKTNLEIVSVLKYLNGTNDIEQYPYPKMFENRFRSIFWIKNGQLYNTNAPKRPFSFPGANLTYMKGCSYNSFSRPYVEWILTSDLPRSFIEWTKDTSAPDEIIWGTLNNHPDAPGGYPVYVAQTSKTFLSREIIWNFSASHCWGKFVHAVCILTLKNYPWLSQRWEFFANKFDLDYDHMIYDCLEQEIMHRTKHPDVDNNVHWTSIDRAPHVHFTRVLNRNITEAKSQRLF